MTLADRLFHHVSCYKMIKARGQEHRRRHRRIIKQLVKRHTPPGSLLPDQGRSPHGTSIDMVESNEDQLVFRTNRRYLDDDGFCLGWVPYTITLEKLLTERLKLHVTPENESVREDFERALYQDEVRGRVLVLQSRRHTVDRMLPV